jgi:hypothetical protein
MATFAPATEQLKIMNTAMGATVTDSTAYAGDPWRTTLSEPKIADTLVLSVFSVAFEIAVFLLRIRSRLSSSSPR